MENMKGLKKAVIFDLDVNTIANIRQAMNKRSVKVT